MSIERFHVALWSSSLFSVNSFHTEHSLPPYGFRITKNQQRTATFIWINIIHLFLCYELFCKKKIFVGRERACVYGADFLLLSLSGSTEIPHLSVCVCFLCETSIENNLFVCSYIFAICMCRCRCLCHQYYHHHQQRCCCYSIYVLLFVIFIVYFVVIAFGVVIFSTRCVRAAIVSIDGCVTLCASHCLAFIIHIHICFIWAYDTYVKIHSTKWMFMLSI